MAFEVVNVSRKPFEYLEPHLPAFFAALDKLIARYPDDITRDEVLIECDSGERTLWFIFEDGKFLSFAMTKDRKITSTGIRVAKLCDLAGERALEAADEICEALEGWADAIEAPIRDIEGRVGWGRELKKRGYEVHAVLYRKKVELNGQSENHIDPGSEAA